MPPSLQMSAVVLASLFVFSACAPTSTPLRSVVAAIQTSVATTPAATPADGDTSQEDPTPSATSSLLCSQEIAGFSAANSSLLREWEDALRVAESTPKIALAPQIAALQALRRQAEDMDSPSCAKAIKALMVSAMNSGTSALLDFASSAMSADIVAGRITQSRDHLEAVKHALAVLEEQSTETSPLTVDQIREQFSGLSWEELVLQNGNSAIRWMQDSYVIEVQHDEGDVFSVTVSRMLFDPKETVDTWNVLIDLALPFLQDWPEIRSQILEYSEQPPSDRLPEPTILREGIQTLELSHVHYDIVDQSLATITIMLPTQ